MWALGTFLLLFFLGLALVAGMIAILPQRYFIDEGSFWPGAPAPVRWTAIVLKNLFGVALVILGVLLSIPGIPGQGILTILIGLVLLDFPGKRKLVRMLARRRGVQSAINRLRSWCGRPPLQFDL